MALWHDPLDDLIDALDLTLPPPVDDARDVSLWKPPDFQRFYSDWQKVFCPIMFGTEEDARRIQQTPLYQKTMARWAELMGGGRKERA
jgi:hypothetical protein